MADEAFSPDFDFVTDLRDVRFFDADYRGIAHLASRLRDVHAEMPETVRYVVLCERDVQFGMARMYQQIVENNVAFSLHLTRTVRAAAEVLGLPEDRLKDMLDAVRVPDDGS
ncbi:hypothetical protein [Tropicibacter sp. S64]|uniref:hypothetical protein n=1 Tax=Tropicibacter sp. S64 TaxID=3415122 RepID=UPI003C7EB630